MEISDDPSMRTPQRGGQAWEGNSMYADKFQSISSAPVGRWKDALSSEELFVLESIDRPQMRAMSYTRSDTKLDTLPMSSRLKVIQKLAYINLKEFVYDR